MSAAKERYRRAWRAARELGMELELAELAERAVASYADARDTYDAIRWGQSPDSLQAADAPAVYPGQVLAVLGRLDYVEYFGEKNGAPTLWLHRFEAQRPQLAVNHEGKLVVVGGDYVVTDRGIVG